MSRIGPGPEEHKLRNRLIFKFTGRWPQSVVNERLAISDQRTREALANQKRRAAA